MTRSCKGSVVYRSWLDFYVHNTLIHDMIIHANFLKRKSFPSRQSEQIIIYGG